MQIYYSFQNDSQHLLIPSRTELLHHRPKMFFVLADLITYFHVEHSATGADIDFVFDVFDGVFNLNILISFSLFVVTKQGN